LADTFNGLMVIPNLIALLGLAKIVFKQVETFANDETGGGAKISIE